MFVFAIISAVVTAISTFSQMEATRKDKEYKAAVERNNAIAKRQQADVTRRKGEVAMRAKDEEKKKLKREYTAAAGTNRSLLAAGNVDLTTGSALDLLEGNYNRFADDAGEIEYQKELTGWEHRREAQIQEWEGDVADSNASYLEKTAGSTGKSLLGGVLAGGASFASSYVAAGGFASGAGAGTGGSAVAMRNPDLSTVSRIA
ncbi:MAG: hypothetical protein GY753_11995 [Gammaproteobacteria bacterium]|nr:hypothetical protein [Gammaproteobacteria bacterium]